MLESQSSSLMSVGRDSSSDKSLYTMISGYSCILLQYYALPLPQIDSPPHTPPGFYLH